VPKLLDAAVKQEMIEAIQGGVSIPRISKNLGLGKSTIYYHYKKIKGKKFKEPFVEPYFSEEEGEIVGIFAGDGSQYYDKKSGHYETNVHFGDKEYALYVKKLFDGYFQKEFNLKNETGGRFRLKGYCKGVYDYFSNYLSYESRKKHCTVKLKTLNCPPAFVKGFLRGLVDTDGTICPGNNKIRIIYYTTSEELAIQLKSLLERFNLKAGISCINRKKTKKAIYHVYLLQAFVEPFLELIKPYKARRVGR